MRLKSAILVAAIVRRANGAGAFSAVVKRGAEEAGAIFVKVARLDGSADLYAPAPQASVGEDDTDVRLFEAIMTAAPDRDVDERLQRERAFDSDLWIVEIEDRNGRHFLDGVGRVA
jgi:hypothetical protein